MKNPIQSTKNIIARRRKAKAKSGLGWSTGKRLDSSVNGYLKTMALIQRGIVNTKKG